MDTNYPPHAADISPRGPYLHLRAMGIRTEMAAPPNRQVCMGEAYARLRVRYMRQSRCPEVKPRQNRGRSCKAEILPQIGHTKSLLLLERENCQASRYHYSKLKAHSRVFWLYVHCHNRLVQRRSHTPASPRFGLGHFPVYAHVRKQRSFLSKPKDTR